MVIVLSRLYVSTNACLMHGFELKYTVYIKHSNTDLGLNLINWFN